MFQICLNVIQPNQGKYTKIVAISRVSILIIQVTSIPIINTLNFIIDDLLDLKIDLAFNVVLLKYKG